MCANSHKKKQDDPPLWVAENCMTHPLPRVQKLMTHPLSAPAHPPHTFWPVPYAYVYAADVSIVRMLVLML